MKVGIKMISVDGIINYSLELKKGEKVFIFADDKSKKYCDLLSKQIIQIGAVPFILWNDIEINRELINCSNDDIYEKLFTNYEKIIDSCDAAIMLDNNIESYKGIDCKDVINFKNKYYLKIMKKIMSFERWVYLRYPQKELAKLFNLTYKEHVKLLEEVSNFDYLSLAQSCVCLKDLLDKTTKIQIIQGEDTNVTFTKNNIPSSICCGKWNLPDGEIYTAPEKFSMNGKLHFNVDSYFRGMTFKNIKMTVTDGKIVSSKCNISDEFDAILDSDLGSRYFGEFAFGLNPYITRNYNDNLFNEKMVKTIHFAIGYSHYNTENGNESIVHWDLIIDMKKDSKIYFDDVLIQQDGIFVDKRLKELNK